MSDNAFIDSNIWLYAMITSDDKQKNTQAKNIISSTPKIHLSTQVLNEVSVNLTHKAGKDNESILKLCRKFIATYHVLQQTSQDLLTAGTLRIDYNFSYWDSLIVASALNNECKILYSEDMQNGLNIYNKLTIRNPL
jgi:predicted nucleic acid-binding protein